MTGCITGWPRLFIKRFVFSRRVILICRKNCYKLEKNGAFWWIGKTKSANHSFSIDCGGKKYCVKLIGIRSRNILFGFIDRERYEIKDYTFAIPSTTFGIEYSQKKKEAYSFDDDAVPCIVMVGNSVKVTVRENTNTMARTEISSNDQTPEGLFFFASDFLNFIKKSDE